jgi:capsular polysaccharide biosynthesis protein
MELKEILGLYKKNLLMFVASFVIGGVLGIIYTSLPKNYLAVGDFYVSRKVSSDQNKYVSYEGFYAQQAAQEHAKNIVSMLESESFAAQVLTGLEEELTEKTLRAYTKRVKIKKAGPQYITLTTKGKTKRETKDLWLKITEILDERTMRMYETGDINLSVTKMNGAPVVRDTFNSLSLNVAVGGLFTLIIYTSLITFSKSRKS